MKFHDFSPFYRSSEGIKPKVSGDRLLDNPLVADAQSGASFKFDGVGDSVTFDASADLNMSGASGMTLSGWVKAGPKNAASSNSYCFGWLADTHNSVLIRVAAESDGTNPNHVVIRSEFSGPSGSTYVTTNVTEIPFSTEWAHIVVTITGTTYKTYYNGVLKATDTGADLSNCESVNGYPIMGDSPGAGSWFQGEIRQVRIHNRALTAAEVRAAYSGQAVPFEYVGASQTELVTGGDFASASGWTFESNVAHDATNNEIDFSSAGLDYGFHRAASSNLIVGKYYRVKFEIKNHSSGSFAVRLGGTYGTVRDEDGVYTEDILVTDASGNWVGGKAKTASTTLTVDDLSVVQIGCVAEYLPTGINSTQWVDTSGNGLHGSTSTATAVNHEVGTITATGVVEVNNGIKFPATQVSSTDANTLDDYEEGAWTPAIYYQNGTDSGNASNGTRDGRYVKIGRMVYVMGRLTWTITGSPANDNVGCSGLPYVKVTQTDHPSTPAFNLVSSDLGSGYKAMTGYLASGASTMLFGSDTVNDNIGNELGAGTFTIHISGVYEANA